MKKLLDWLDDRTGYRGIVYDALYENIPGGARWRYVWGSTLVFAFFVQLVTGFVLWTAYSPNAQGAWESVYYIQHEMQGGWLLRGVHHFMAQAMVVLLALHLMQVVIDGAYKAPREVNFWLGLVLMMIVLGFSLTGYLLPWDQKGFWATTVATNIAGITPGIGPQIQEFIVGGPEYGHQTLTRFFAIHAGLLPALLIVFLAMHIYVFRRHGITSRAPERRPATTFWPDQILRDGVACLAVLAAVLLLVYLPNILHGGPPGADLGPPADPPAGYGAPRPEWYFLWLFQLLKYFPGETEIIGTHVVPGLGLLVLFLMPFLGRWKLGHAFNVGFLCAAFLGMGLLTAMSLRADRGDQRYLAAKEEDQRTAERMPALIEHVRIDTRGAVALVREDPYLQGPKLFAQFCASCHRYDGHDGAGKTLTEPATAADLGDFATPDWWRSLLVNYEGHFAPFEKAVWYQQALAQKAAGESPTFIDLDEGEMAGWSRDNREALSDPRNKRHRDALAEFLASQSGRGDRQVDPELVELGRETMENLALAEGALTQSCTDCHSSFEPGAKFQESDEDNLGYPALTGYGSVAWLKSFIGNPGTPQHYGEKNRMPAFREQLTPREIELIARWMAGDYPQ
ncbi:MAG: cytochrome b N-terminal domain-containing protein [Planctomycetales bacterium]